MRKFSLLLGALGGAMAGYLLSNNKLRDALIKAKDAEAAAKTLGKHLQRDGRKLAKEVQTFIESDDVQRNLVRAKKFALAKVEEAKKQAHSLLQAGQSRATQAAVRGMKSAKVAVKRTTNKAKATGAKAVKTFRSEVLS